MEVTVRKIMELDAFAQATTLLAGHAGIDKTVNFITVSETPDFYEWVTGGEFVLTTLFTYEQHRDLLIHNYTELAKRGVIAVGVKVNRFVECFRSIDLTEPGLHLLSMPQQNCLLVLPKAGAI